MNQPDLFQKISSIKTTQTDDLIAYMKTGKAISFLSALNHLGIGRLPARIWDMKRRGFDVHDRMVTGTARNGRRYAVKEYSL